MRQRFVEVTTAALDRDKQLAVVLAAISADAFAPASRSWPERVIDVGIREQLAIGVAAGLALEGMRPVVHTYAPFLIERPYESLKVDLGHQGLGAVLVSIGASYDEPGYGRTHQCPEDVQILDALSGWEIAVPGHPDEVEVLLRHALAGSHLSYIRLSEAENRRPLTILPGKFTVLRRGSSATVIAVGPMLDPCLAAVGELDVTLIYASTIRPFDAATLLATLSVPDVVLVEPYLAGTSTAAATKALSHLPHRLLGLGLETVDLHCYGSRADHDRAHGLDPSSIAHSITGFLART